MSLTERLREELDQSFGSEPADRPVQQRVADGRRALRRRRAVGAAAACGVVVALGTTYAVGSPGPDRDADRISATDPSPGPTPSGSPSTSPRWERGSTVRYVDGELQVRPGAVVHQHIANPYHYRLPNRSDALDLTYAGHRTWVLVEDTDAGFTSSSSVPSNGWASFRAWVEDQVAAGAGDGTTTGWPTTMEQAADGRVVPTQGTRVYQRTDDPRLGDRFAPAGATTGAAIVRPPGSPFTYFVVWRVIDGQLDVITTAPRDTTGATFDELLHAARTRYAGGQGLR